LDATETRQTDRVGDEEQPGRLRRLGGRMVGKVRGVNLSSPALRMTASLRQRLPGDSSYGDPLSLSGDDPTRLVGQRLVANAGEPSALRELGLSALQVWQVARAGLGRSRTETEVTVMFVDLVKFSPWALRAGDDKALELLRQVGVVVEPPITKRHGRIVKRLGDGLMAVFDDPTEAVEAACEATLAVQALAVDGYDPRLRVGLHHGRPLTLGGDWFGVDVNVAARVTNMAGADDVLVSGTVADRLDTERFDLRRKWRANAKGVPKGLRVYKLRDDAAA
jgi:adenylate cyclase